MELKIAMIIVAKYFLFVFVYTNTHSHKYIFSPVRHVPALPLHFRYTC